MWRAFSPAKINLFLRVMGKRSDGYHELSSLFQAIDLGDTLELDWHEHDVLTCTDPSIPTDETNLVVKAIQLFRKKKGLKTGVKVHLHKRIPMQAGLGGGSSNAATTLWMLNQMAGQVASLEDLKNWSAEIGSDVPFFFSQGTAYCTGRGEMVHHLPAFSARSCWIVKPQIGLSTPEIYRLLCAQPLKRWADPQSRDLDRFLSGLPHYFNDLEKPAFEAKPELKIIKDLLLQSGFETVLMTGSGSAFFCLGAGQVPPEANLVSYQAKFLNRKLFDWYQV